MKIFLTKIKLSQFVKNEKNLGFVPTMGALHLGHVSLIKRSLSQCNKTIVSIFVNKPQFNMKSDFKKYPKTLNKDIKILKRLKVSYLYLPTHNQIYPDGINKNIRISNFKKKLCGKFRPGHFEAIVDVVDRFIKIIKPNRIYFGEKDFQQLKIIENFVGSRYKKIKIIACKTIREKNGIACSSRNILLSKTEKRTATKIYNLLNNQKKNIVKKKISLNLLKKKIHKFGVKKIDYLKLLDINKLVQPYKKNRKYKIFVAYYLGSTRLIDNI